MFQLNCYSMMDRHICCCSTATPLPLFKTPTMPLQAGNGEFVCGFQAPPNPIFSQWSLFQLNCSSIHCAPCFPSVDMVNKPPLLQSHELWREGGVGEFSSPFYFPPIPNFFSQLYFPIQLLTPVTLAQPINGTRSHHHHPLPSCCVEKMVMLSFSLFYFFSFQTFLTAFFPS